MDLGPEKLISGTVETQQVTIPETSFLNISPSRRDVIYPVLPPMPSAKEQMGSELWPLNHGNMMCHGERDTLLRGPAHPEERRTPQEAVLGVGQSIRISFLGSAEVSARRSLARAQ